MELKIGTKFVCLLVVFDLTSAVGFFNMSLTKLQLPTLQNFFKPTTPKPVVIVPSAQPPFLWDYKPQYTSPYVLVFEKAETPFVNQKYLDVVNYKVQKLNFSLAVGIGKIRLKKSIQHATLLSKVFSCRNGQCDSCVIDNPKYSFCNYIQDFSHSCNSYFQGPTGCTLAPGDYTFMNYIPLYNVPQEIPGQRWKIQCFLAQNGRRIATFDIYSRCGSHPTRPTHPTNSYGFYNYEEYPTINTKPVVFDPTNLEYPQNSQYPYYSFD